MDLGLEGTTEALENLELYNGYYRHVIRHLMKENDIEIEELLLQGFIFPPQSFTNLAPAGFPRTRRRYFLSRRKYETQINYDKVG